MRHVFPHFIEATIARLVYKQGVLVVASPKDEVWKIYGWCQREREMFATQKIFTQQLHEYLCVNLNDHVVMAVCYPACNAQMTGSGTVVIDSIGFPIYPPNHPDA